MGYKTKVFNYGSKLTEYEQSELMSIIKRCIGDGYTYEWIWKALQHKEVDEWRKHGYGLFLNKGFRTEISNKLVKTRKEEEQGCSLFTNADSLPEESLSVSSSSSDSKRFADGSTPNQVPSIQEQKLENKEEHKGNNSEAVTDEEILKLIRYEREYDFSKVTYAGKGKYIAYPTDWCDSEDLTLEELDRIRSIKYNLRQLDFDTPKQKRDFDIALRAIYIASHAMKDKKISVHSPEAIKDKLEQGFVMGNGYWLKPGSAFQDSDKEKAKNDCAPSKRPPKGFREWVLL